MLHPMAAPEGRKRSFHSLSFKGAHYRFCGARVELLSRTIRRLRRELEQYIRRFPDFGSSLVPFTDIEELPAHPPESAIRMHRASLAVYTGTGGKFCVGPMAAVAGTFAELSVEAALSSISSNNPSAKDERDIVLENGGDIFMLLQRPVNIALFAGPESPFAHLAFRVEPEVYHDAEPGRREKKREGKAVCSSSGKMGHSLSFGSCDLATVFSRSASLADAAATALCNSVTSIDKMEEQIERAWGIEGIDGAVAVYGDKLGRVGDVPALVRHDDPDLTLKIV